MTREQEAIMYFEGAKKRLEDFRKIYPSPDTVGYQATTKEIGFYDMAISALSEKRPKGEWLLIGHDDTCNFYKCSFCGYEEHDNFTKHHKFCPNCGADMRGDT